MRHQGAAKHRAVSQQASRAHAQESNETLKLKRQLLTGELAGNVTPRSTPRRAPQSHNDGGDDMSEFTGPPLAVVPEDILHDEAFLNLVDMQQRDHLSLSHRQQEADALLARLRSSFDVCNGLDLSSYEKLRGSSVADFIQQSQSRRRALLGNSAGTHRTHEMFRSALETERQFKAEIEGGGDMALDEQLILLTMEERNQVDPNARSDVDELGMQLGLLDEHGEYKSRFCGCQEHFEAIKSAAEQSARTFCKAKYFTAFVHRLDVMVEFVQNFTKQASEKQAQLLERVAGHEKEVDRLRLALDATIAANRRLREAAKKGGVRTNSSGEVVGYEDGLVLECTTHAKANVVWEGEEMRRRDADAFVDATRARYLQGVGRGSKQTAECQTLSERELFIQHGIEAKSAAFKDARHEGPNTDLARAVLRVPHLHLAAILGKVDIEAWGGPVVQIGGDVEDTTIPVQFPFDRLVSTINERMEEAEGTRVDTLTKVATSIPEGSVPEGVVAAALRDSYSGAVWLFEALRKAVGEAAAAVAADVRRLRKAADDAETQLESVTSKAQDAGKRHANHMANLEAELTEAKEEVFALKALLAEQKVLEQELQRRRTSVMGEEFTLATLPGESPFAQSSRRRTSSVAADTAGDETTTNDNQAPREPVTTSSSRGSRKEPPVKPQKVVVSNPSSSNKVSTPVGGASRDEQGAKPPIRRQSSVRDPLRDLLVNKRLVNTQEAYHTMEEALCRLMAMLGDLHGPILEGFDVSYGRRFLTPAARRDILKLGDHLVVEEGDLTEEDADGKDVLAASQALLGYVQGLGETLARRVAEVPIPREMVELSLVIESRVGLIEGACLEAGIWGGEDDVVKGEPRRLQGLSTSLVSTIRPVTDVASPSPTDLVNTLRRSIGAKRRGTVHASAPTVNADVPLLATLLSHLHTTACRIDALTSVALQRRLPQLVSRASVATNRMDVIGSKVEDIINTVRSMLWSLGRAFPELASPPALGREGKLFLTGTSDVPPEPLLIHAGEVALSPSAIKTGTLSSPEEATVRMVGIWSLGLHQYSRALNTLLQLADLHAKSTKYKSASPQDSSVNEAARRTSSSKPPAVLYQERSPSTFTTGDSFSLPPFTSNAPSRNNVSRSQSTHTLTPESQQRVSPPSEFSIPIQEADAHGGKVGGLSSGAGKGAEFPVSFTNEPLEGDKEVLANEYPTPRPTRDTEEELTVLRWRLAESEQGRLAALAQVGGANCNLNPAPTASPPSSRTQTRAATSQLPQSVSPLAADSVRSPTRRHTVSQPSNQPRSPDRVRPQVQGAPPITSSAPSQPMMPSHYTAQRPNLEPEKGHNIAPFVNQVMALAPTQQARSPPTSPMASSRLDDAIPTSRGEGSYPISTQGTFKNDTPGRSTLDSSCHPLSPPSDQGRPVGRIQHGPAVPTTSHEVRRVATPPLQPIAAPRPNPAPSSAQLATLPTVSQPVIPAPAKRAPTSSLQPGGSDGPQYFSPPSLPAFALPPPSKPPSQLAFALPPPSQPLPLSSQAKTKVEVKPPSELTSPILHMHTSDRVPTSEIHPTAQALPAQMYNPLRGAHLPSPPAYSDTNLTTDITADMSSEVTPLESARESTLHSPVYPLPTHPAATSKEGPHFPNATERNISPPPTTLPRKRGPSPSATPREAVRNESSRRSISDGGAIAIGRKLSLQMVASPGEHQLAEEVPNDTHSESHHPRSPTTGAPPPAVKRGTEGPSSPDIRGWATATSTQKPPLIPFSPSPPQHTPVETMESSISSVRQNNSFGGYHAFEGSLNASTSIVGGESRQSAKSGSMSPPRNPTQTKSKRVSFPFATTSIDSVGLESEDDTPIPIVPASPVKSHSGSSGSVPPSILTPPASVSPVPEVASGSPRQGPPSRLNRPVASRRRPQQDPDETGAAGDSAPNARRRTIADRAHIQMHRRRRRGTQDGLDEEEEDELSTSSLAVGTLLQADDIRRRMRKISDLHKQPGREEQDRQLTLAMLREAKAAESQRSGTVDGQRREQERTEAVLDAFSAMLTVTDPAGGSADDLDMQSPDLAHLPMPAAMLPSESNKRLIHVAAQGGARGKLALIIMRAMAVGKMQRLLKQSREQQREQEGAMSGTTSAPRQPRGVLDMEEINRLLRLEVEARKEEDDRKAKNDMAIAPLSDSITLATPELITVISEADSGSSSPMFSPKKPNRSGSDFDRAGSSESLQGIKAVHTDSTPTSEVATVDDIIMIHERIHEFARLTFAATGVAVFRADGGGDSPSSVLSLQERCRRAYVRSLEMLEAHFFFHPDSLKDNEKGVLRSRMGGFLPKGGEESGLRSPVPEHVLLRHARSVPTTVFDVLEVSADLVMGLLEQVKEMSVLSTQAVSHQVPLPVGCVAVPADEYNRFKCWQARGDSPVRREGSGRASAPTAVLSYAPHRKPDIMAIKQRSTTPPRVGRDVSGNQLASLIREHQSIVHAVIPTSIDLVQRSHQAAKALRVDATAPRDPSPPHALPRVTAPIPLMEPPSLPPNSFPASSSVASRLLLDPKHRLAGLHKPSCSSSPGDTWKHQPSFTQPHTAPQLVPLAASAPVAMGEMEEPDPRKPAALQIRKLPAPINHIPLSVDQRTTDAMKRLNELLETAPPYQGIELPPVEPSLTALRTLRGARAAVEARRSQAERSPSPDQTGPKFFVYSVASHNGASMTAPPTTALPQADLSTLTVSSKQMHTTKQ